MPSKEPLSMTTVVFILSIFIYDSNM
ncbi:hypothetical protein SAMN04488601_1091 [Paenibacillus sp. 453mf]|nr:hypothetical protein SAMN04488601_1091 [Paenibacillus sp. 453mf]